MKNQPPQATSNPVMLSKLTRLAVLALAVACLTARADITTGLRLHLKMDDTTGSVATNAAAPAAPDANLFSFPVDDSQWTTGRISGALRINADYLGGDDRVTVDDSAAALDFSGVANPAFTLSAWVRSPIGFVQTNGAAIICHGFGRGGEQYSMDLFQSSFRLYVRDAGGVAYTIQQPPAATNISDGTWQHVVGVFDSTLDGSLSNRLKLYINGILIGQTNGPTALLVSPHEVSIGSREDNVSSGYNLPFTGLMDDVRIYGRALSSSDVQELYLNAGTAGPTFALQPSSFSRFVLESGSLNALVDGTAPITYQWWKNNAPIPGATNNSLTFPVLSLTNAGTYFVAATNAYGFAISSNAVLTVSELATNDITTALIARWTFDETSGTTANDSVGTNKATLYQFLGDDSQWVPGRLGRALRFNAVNGETTPNDRNDYVWTDAPVYFPFNSNLVTCTFWARIHNADQGTNPRMMTPATGTATGNPTWIYWRRSGGQSPAIGAADPRRVPTAAIPSYVWRHYAVVWDTSAGNYTLYVNGQFVTNATSGFTRTAAQVTALRWAFGHSENLTAAGDVDFFRGDLDDVRIYNRLMTSNQVSALYADAGPYQETVIVVQPQSATVNERDPVTFNIGADSTAPLAYQWKKGAAIIPGATASSYTIDFASAADVANYSVVISNAAGTVTSSAASLTVNALPATDLTNNLIAHYKFDETSGDVAHDATGIYDASLMNWSGTERKWEPGVLGNALHFNSDDTNDWVETPPITLGNSIDFTFTFWAKVNPTNLTANNPRIISPAGAQSWVVWMRSAPLGIGFWHGNGGLPAPETALWHHYTVTFNRVTSRFNVYVDGVRKVFAGIPTNPAVENDPNGLPWVIGHRENINPAQDQESFRGWLDDLRFYNRQFTINEAESLYQAANQPPTVAMSRTNNTLTVSWPSWASDFTLQSAPALSPSGTGWTNVPGTPNLIGTTRSLSDPVGNGTKFYRLRRQLP